MHADSPGRVKALPCEAAKQAMLWVEGQDLSLESHLGLECLGYAKLEIRTL